MSRTRRAVDTPLGWCMSLLCVCTVHAQTASLPDLPRTPTVVPRPAELTPPRVDVPSLAPLPSVLYEVPRELGKPDDERRIDIKVFVVDDDAPAALKSRLAELTKDFVGKNRGFEDLYGARVEVTRFLQSELGYYLGYAYVPEQAFDDGVVRIAVLEGRLDKVTLIWPANKVLPLRRAVLQAYLARLEAGSILMVRDVERVVFLVNDLRGIKTRFEVQAGSKPGTAEIVVTPEAESIWSGKADADINGSRFLGEYRLGGLLQMSSPFGRGDGLTANALVSTTQGLAFGLLS